MNYYLHYKVARNMAWKVLLDNKITSFPIDLPRLAKKYGINIYAYSQAENTTKVLKLDTTVEAIALIYGGQRYIFYDEHAKQERCYFSIAHEFGHHIRDHVTTDINLKYTFHQEREANAFAVNLTMPAMICKYENLDTAKKIADFFKVSNQAANIRIQEIDGIFSDSATCINGFEELYCNLYRHERF